MQVKPIVEQLKTYVEWKLRPVKWALNNADISGKLEDYWQIMPQWNSALFTNSVTYTVVKVANPLDPLKVKIITESTAEFNDYAKEMIGAAKAQGLPLHRFCRTGGPFQTNVQTKSLARYAEQADQITRAQELFKMPEYVNVVLPRHIMLLKQSRERTMANLAKIKENGELATVGKLPTVSTGWGSPIKTRGDLGQNLPKIYDQVVAEINDFYDQLIAAVEQAPADGCDITINGLFHGILKGVRDDADVIDCTEDLVHQVIESGTRKTGVVPSSMAHNPGLDPATYRRNEVWARYATEYTLLPFDPNTVTDVISHRHATMPGDDPEELVWCSFDIGYQENSPRYTNRLEIPDPGKTLGADSIMMAGKLLKVFFTPEQQLNLIAMLESGAEFTMDWYLVLTGVFAEWARGQNLTKNDFRFMSIGDDLQLLIKRRLLPDFLAKFGPWMKAKGMKVHREGAKTFHVAFLVGTFIGRTEQEPGKIYAWVSPRHIKTTPGPKVKELIVRDLPGHKPYLKVGETITLTTPEEQRKEIADYWAQWKALVYYFGPEEEYLRMLQSRNFWLGRYLASKLGGGSEWLDDEFDARDMGQLEEKRAPSKEPEQGAVLASRTLGPEGSAAGETAPPAPAVLDPSYVKERPEKCDKCGRVVTDVQVKKAAKVTGPHYHLPPEGKDVLALADSGRTPAQYEEDKKASDPKHQVPGKDHADWPKGVPLPVDKVPVLKHYHTHGNKTLCVPCSGTTEDEWAAAQKATDPKYLRPGSLNASWPEGKPWPITATTPGLDAPKEDPEVKDTPDSAPAAAGDEAGKTE